MTRRIGFWFDYGAEMPLWWAGGGPVESQQVPLSTDLVQELRAFQEQLEDESPGEGEEWDPALIKKGRALLARVQQELAPDYVVQGLYEYA